jgi:hypothetical protein
MKRLSAITAGLLVIAALAAGCAGRSGSGSGWVTLLDGSAASLNDNWIRIGDANWRSEGGLIVADRGKTSYLLTKDSYRDYQIRAEFWADHTTNSGIFMRIADPQKIGAATSYEVNIYDQRPEPAYGTGAIVDYAKVSPMPKAGGRWNTFLITAKGTNLVVEMNGVQTVNIHDSKYASGPFALQFANGPRDAPGGAIKWRKVQIRPL